MRMERLRPRPLALPPRDSHQVLEKIELLCRDPLPDSTNVKKKLEGYDDLYRIRVGNRRLFYTIERPYVSLLALRPRPGSPSGTGRRC